MPENKHDSYPVALFETAGLFEKWLVKNHRLSDGVWLKIAKISSGKKSVSYQEALDIALCYGWIDGLRRGMDAEFFLQKFTPRRPDSIWSAINKKKADDLIMAGRMQEFGYAAIEVAKKNGRWDNAYGSPKTIVIPEEFQKALDKNPKAKIFFKTLSSQNRYALLFRIHQAKSPDIKKRKIEEFIKMLKENKTIYPQ